MGPTYKYRRNSPSCLVGLTAIAVILIIVVVWVAALSWLFMTLWNIIAVGFGATTIDLTVAFACVGLLMLVGALLGRGRTA